MRSPLRCPPQRSAIVLLLLGLVSLTLLGHANATTLRVPPEYSTIQAALDASGPGDTVLVAPGTYADRATRTLGPPIPGVPNPVTALAIVPRGVTLLSESGAETAILDGLDGAVRGVVLSPGFVGSSEREAGLAAKAAAAVPHQTVLDGFTVVNSSTAVLVGGAEVLVARNLVDGRVEVVGGARGRFEENVFGPVDETEPRSASGGPRADDDAADLYALVTQEYLEAARREIDDAEVLDAAGLLCVTTSEEGIDWHENEFASGLGDLICRCRRMSWTHNRIRSRLALWPNTAGAPVTVTDNVFEGAGISGVSGQFLVARNDMNGMRAAIGILLFSGATGVVENNQVVDYIDGMSTGVIAVRYNRITDCGAGIDGLGTGVGSIVHHNTILNCRVWGIIAAGGTLTPIEDNEIRGCGGDGINIGVVAGVGNGPLRRNLVWFNGGHGIRQSRGIIEGNIVAFNEGDGIRTGGGANSKAPSTTVGPIVASNTIVGNGDKGLWIGFSSATSGSRIEQNIIAFNTGDGLSCVNATFPLVIECNNAYGNGAADFGGLCPEVGGGGGNFSLDPLFCSYETRDLKLQASSPCAPGNGAACRLIGAEPVGCLGDRDLKDDGHAVPTSWGSLKGRYWE